jgi:hypothetical protein
MEVAEWEQNKAGQGSFMEHACELPSLSNEQRKTFNLMPNGTQSPSSLWPTGTSFLRKPRLSNGRSGGGFSPLKIPKPIKVAPVPLMKSAVPKMQKVAVAPIKPIRLKF